MARLLPSGRLRWLAIAGYALAALALAALLAIAAFPIGLLKPTVERRLSARFGRPVTIGALERRGAFSFTPTILIRDLRVPQPAWAGPGDLARVVRAEVTLAALPLLAARVEPRAIAVAGARIALVRTGDGRENWRGPRPDTPSDQGPVLATLSLADTRLSYRDAKQDRAFDVAVTAGPAGLAARGTGQVLGFPVRVAFTGPRVAPGAWPFRASIEGPVLSLVATGSMAAALDTNRMDLDLTARANDLKQLDAIIEAGLFHSQPVRFAAHVERRAPVWRVTRVAGTIGTSRIAGEVTVDKVDGRTKLDGRLVAAMLDFDDLASDASIAAATAETARIGRRVVPKTRVDLSKTGATDGRVDVRIERIGSRRGPSALRTARASIVLDRRRLTVDGLRIGLTRGAITGRAIVDQRDGAPSPRVTLDLRLTGSSVGALAGGDDVTGRVDARVRLAGRGDTLRDAVGASDGRIGVVARDGALPARIAAALGFDAGRALTADAGDRARLRCAVVGLDVRGGRGRVDPLVIDTSASRMRGEGVVAFPGETLAIRLTGAPKRDALIRLPGSASVGGTIQSPDVSVPKEVRSAGNILRAIGRAITGRQGPVATDADCAALAARVLR